jgi:hypothetical protein
VDDFKGSWWRLPGNDDGSKLQGTFLGLVYQEIPEERLSEVVSSKVLKRAPYWLSIVCQRKVPQLGMASSYILKVDS